MHAIRRTFRPVGRAMYMRRSDQSVRYCVLLTDMRLVASRALSALMKLLPESIVFGLMLRLFALMLHIYTSVLLVSASEDHCYIMLRGAALEPHSVRPVRPCW